ncbi:MAG: hypothetical protein HKO98_16150 [Gemmatimonadetes bacterium]|nr:hypothetical protein [Gemmatimonadota bacterium]NNK64733.1 hypothetical protein [Gemmatimonadota bacterium]
MSRAPCGTACRRGFFWAFGLVVCAGAIPSAFVSPSGLAAQELTLTLGRAGSDYREFDAGTAIGVDVSVFPRRVLGLRVGLRRNSDDGEWTRSTCVGLIPPDSEVCRDDRFTASYSWLSIGVGPEVRLSIGERWGVTAAALVSRMWIDGRWRGEESGLRIGDPPDGAVLGFTALGGVTWSLNSRWGLTFLGRVDDPQFTRCISDTYDPFCDGGSLRTLEMGVTVRR